MRVTDPIADLIVRIKNAGLARKAYAVVPASMLKIEIVSLLEREGFVGPYRLIKDSHQGKIKISIKYDALGNPVLSGAQRVSRPGRRVFIPVRAFSRLVRDGVGIYIVSTPRGVLTANLAKSENVGGELMLKIW